MKLLKLLNFKSWVLIGIAVALAFVYFLFFHNPIQDIPYDIEYLGLKVEPLVFEGRRVHFPYTDENEGENIIIKSDKKIYEGGDRSDVYFTLTNTSDKSEKVAILSYFPKEYGDINYIDVWSRPLAEVEPQNPQRGSTSKLGWQRLPMTRGDIKANMTKLKKAWEKKKPVPDKFDVKAGIQFEISAGHTAYFKSEILYPMDGKGEFWFEAFGDQGGYGLLDPIFVGQTTTSKDTTPGWYSGSWSYRKRITIDKKKVSGTSDLSSFPVLISRTDSDFKHTSFGGNVASSSAGPTGGGGDFVFTSSDGTTKIDHEIEKYASSSGEIIAWVEVPTLSVSADTVLYVYYGGPSTGATNQNKTGTWDSNFKGVWHLPNGTTLTVLDSTSNANNGTLNNSPTAATGQIDGGMTVNGSTQDMTKTSNSGLAVDTGDLSISVWIKTSANPTYGAIFDKGVSNTTRDYSLFMNAGKLAYFGVGSSSGSDGSGSLLGVATLNNGSWHQISWRRAGSANTIYVDGVSDVTFTAGAITDSASTLSLGKNPSGGGSAWDGSYDELRVSNTARSADWIKTEYNNQFKPSTFYGFGGQQSRTSSTTKIGQTTTSKDTPPGWYSESWSYRRKLIGDHKRVSGTSDLSNFPILISETNPDFKHTSFGGKVASSSAGLTGGGGDFVFTSSDGTTKIDHEIEKYASSSGEILVWVEIPTLSVSADTVLYVYYGGPSTGATNQNVTGVWDANYKGVWHLGNGTTLTALDSTSNAHNGTLVNTPTATTGKIGGAANFLGTSSQNITCGTNVTDFKFAATDSFTDQVWVNITLDDGNWRGIFTYSRDATWHGIWKDTTDNWVFGESGGGGNLVGSTITFNTWHHVAAVQVGSTSRILYVDGVQVATDSNELAANGTGTCMIGGASTQSEYLTGYIDEARISSTNRSADWLKTEYDNMVNPGRFIYGTGGLESRTSSTTKIGQTTTSKDTTPGWYSGSWSYRKRITIDKKKVSGTSDLSSFPVLVSRTDSDFKHTSFGGNVASSSAGATGGGGDFVFTSIDGTTKIDHEIEKYASSSGEIIAWVEVPTLSVSADTVLYVYYGGPSTGATNQNVTGTWDTNFVGVWHLPNGTTLGALDSTSNGNNGTITGTVAGTGKIDGAGKFVNSTDVVDVGSATSLDNISQGTITMWIKPTSVATFNKSIYVKRGGTNNLNFVVADSNAGDLIVSYNRSTTNLRALTAGSFIAVDEWQFVAGVWNASGANGDQHLYKGTSSGFAEANYSARTVGSGTHDDSSASVGIGNRADGTAGMPGLIDEVRVSNSARSADWIKTEYDNQSKPSTFYGFGGQQKRN